MGTQRKTVLVEIEAGILNDLIDGDEVSFVDIISMMQKFKAKHDTGTNFRLCMEDYYFPVSKLRCDRLETDDEYSKRIKKEAAVIPVKRAKLEDRAKKLRDRLAIVENDIENL